jgi:hypothetical protein
MMTRAARMSKASAKVSTISMPFAPAGDGGVAGVAAIRTLVDVTRKRNTERLQMTGIQTQDGRHVAGRIRKGGQQRDRPQRDDRSAHHPGAGPKLGAAAEDDRSAFHLQAGEVAHETLDRDDAALHPHPDLEPSGAADDDRAVAHACRTSTIGRANLTSDVAGDTNQASRHFAANPVRRIPGDID